MVHSALGGNCRLRTNGAVQVAGASTQPATGENPNALFSFIDPGKPLVVDAAKLDEVLALPPLVVDFETQKGKIYVITTR